MLRLTSLIGCGSTLNRSVFPFLVVVLLSTTSFRERTDFKRTATRQNGGSGGKKKGLGAIRNSRDVKISGIARANAQLRSASPSTRGTRAVGAAAPHPAGLPEGIGGSPVFWATTG
jgi:hypothetical protein